MLLTCLGLIAFTSSMEFFLIRKLKIYEAVIIGAASLSMFWPIYWLSITGAVVFLTILVIQLLEWKRGKNISA
jgi:TRAP-type uncharacterized transport system fused permease subunit